MTNTKPIHLHFFFVVLTLFSYVQATEDGWLQHNWDKTTHTPICGIAAQQQNTLSLKGSVLFWTTCREQMDFAEIRDTSPSSKVFSTLSPTQNMRFAWDTGYRFTAEHLLCNCWNIHLQLTTFTNKGKDYASYFSADASSRLIPTRQPNFPFLAIITAVEAEISIDYHSIDGCIGYKFCLDRAEITPFAGIKAIQIDQHIRYTLLDTVFSNQKLGDGLWESELSAMGAQAGCQAKLFGNGSFHLYSSFAGSVMGGDADNHQKHVLGLEPPSVASIHDHLCLFGAQLGVGLQYENCFGNFRFTLGAGYELNWYSKIPTQRRFSDIAIMQEYTFATGYYGGSGTTLGLHGGTFHIGLVF